MSDPAPVDASMVRVVSGSPAPDELAAVLVVLLAAAAGEGPGGDGAPTSSWSAPAARLHTAYGPGRGGWRASALPR